MQHTVSNFETQASNIDANGKVIHMPLDTIGGRIRAAREALRMSGPDFATALAPTLSKSSVYHWENGRADVPDKYYVQMLKLGINPTWILTGQGDMFVANPDVTTDTVKGNATVVGHVAEPTSPYGEEGWDYMKRMMNTAGILIERHTIQLDDHEQRITKIESFIGEMSPH